MVSLKLSLTVASAALVQFAAARRCTGYVQDDLTGQFGGSGGHNYKIQVWFNDNPDEILDEQNSYDNKQLDIHDGVQTLKSDALGGDLLLWVDKEAPGETSGLGRQIGGCRAEYMDQEVEGQLGETHSSCSVEFEC